MTFKGLVSKLMIPLVFGGLAFSLYYSSLREPSLGSRVMVQEKYKPGVLVVDWQEGFAPFLIQKELHAETGNLLKLLAAAEARKIPIFLIKVRNQGKLIFPIAKMVEKLSDPKIVNKRYDDSFEFTDLDDLLQEKGINTLYTAGIFASLCHKKTLETAKELGYNFVTCRCLMMDCHPYANESIDFYSSKGVVVDDVDQMIKLMDEGIHRLSSRVQRVLCRGADCAISFYDPSE